MTDALFETPTASPTPVGGVVGHTVDPAAGTLEREPADPAVGSARVVGLDLSLKRTGVATAAGSDSLTPPDGLKGLARLRWIRAAVLGWARDADLIVVERVTYSTIGQYAKENAGLWYVVMVAIDARQIRWIDVVSNTRAKYATGNGRADKDAVLKAAIRRLPIEVENNDEADAAWLCALGHDLLGQPLVDLPATHRDALNTVRPRLPRGLS